MVYNEIKIDLHNAPMTLSQIEEKKRLVYKRLKISKWMNTKFRLISFVVALPSILTFSPTFFTFCVVLSFFIFECFYSKFMFYYNMEYLEMETHKIEVFDKNNNMDVWNKILTHCDDIQCIKDYLIKVEETGRPLIKGEIDAINKYATYYREFNINVDFMKKERSWELTEEYLNKLGGIYGTPEIDGGYI